MQIELRVEAKNDLVHGANFYELQRGGLGDKFIDAVVDSLEALRCTVGIHAIVMGYHRRIVDRFPFAI